jgi:rod shape-determining protein MreB
MPLFDFLLKETIGIDPGSESLRLIKDGDLIFNERSEISIDRTTNSISGFGNNVRRTINDLVLKPVNYSIADFQGFEMLLRSAVKKAIKPRRVLPPSYRIFFCIPTGITEVEKRAYRDSAEHAGAVELYMTFQSISASIGMNLLAEIKNFILIDFGASKIEVTVFANGLIISDGVFRFGTSKIYRLLENHIRRKYKVDVEAKDIDDALNTLKKSVGREEIKIRYANIKLSEIQSVLNNFFNLVNDEILETIERVISHAEIEKVIMNGAYFTGGGSTIDFLRDQIKLDGRIKRTVSQNPFLDNINGLEKIMADKQKYKDYLMV